MTETASFGNLVNALNSVRSDYHGHLKSIAQYEAFLLVENSTQKALETLHGVVNSRAPSMAAEVISSLETAKTKFKEHLTSVPEYRALLAIDKLIEDVSIDLGIRPASAQMAFPTAEPAPPSHETTSIQPEADLAVSPSEHTATAEVAEIAATHQMAPAQPEPDFADSLSEHTATPEVAEIAATHQMPPAQPEPDFADSLSEHTATPEVAEIASAHQMAPAQPEPDIAVSWQDHTFRQLGIALTQSLAEGQNYSGAPIAQEDAGTRLQSEEIALAAIEDLYVTEDLYIEPSSAPFDEGPEKAA